MMNLSRKSRARKNRIVNYCDTINRDDDVAVELESEKARLAWEREIQIRLGLKEYFEKRKIEIDVQEKREAAKIKSINRIQEKFKKLILETQDMNEEIPVDNISSSSNDERQSSCMHEGGNVVNVTSFKIPEHLIPEVQATMIRATEALNISTSRFKEFENVCVDQQFSKFFANQNFAPTFIDEKDLEFEILKSGEYTALEDYIAQEFQATVSGKSVNEGVANLFHDISATRGTPDEKVLIQLNTNSLLALIGNTDELTETLPPDEEYTGGVNNSEEIQPVDKKNVVQKKDEGNTDEEDEENEEDEEREDEEEEEKEEEEEEAEEGEEEDETEYVIPKY